MTKIFVAIIISILFIPKVHSLELLTLDSLKIDTSIVRSDLSYSIPEKIVVVPIFSKDDSIKMNSTSRFRGLYYYLIQKLGFSDIPFHYVVSDDGEIFQGNSGGDERKVVIEGIDSSVILVGYLGGALREGFDPRSFYSLSELLLNISNTNNIRPENTIISNITFVRDSISRSVVMRSTEIDEKWNESLAQIINSYSSKYSPTPKIYGVTAQIVGIPSEEVLPGSENNVSIRLKNVGKNGIYGGSNSELVLSKVGGGNSRFFLNNAWLSKTETSIMVLGQNLLPNQEDIYEFKIRAPLEIGEVTELFELKTLSGTKVESETIALTLKIKRGDKEIIQINETELGFLRVRNEPSTLGIEIGRASSGERFFILEDAGNGYLKIELDGGVTGWVAGWLTTRI